MINYETEIMLCSNSVADALPRVRALLAKAKGGYSASFVAKRLRISDHTAQESLSLLIRVKQVAVTFRKPYHLTPAGRTAI